jgi:hypothetical protein
VESAMKYRIALRKNRPGAIWQNLDKPYDLTSAQLKELKNEAKRLDGQLVAIRDWTEQDPEIGREAA